MKIVIIGGYGAFGALTARMLVRDGHKVWLAGRTPQKARDLAQEIKASAIDANVDRTPEAVFEPKPDLVIDAAGPFQDYGSDRYRIPEMCIERRCNYLDLSDGTDFTIGISELDAAARAAGVFVLSGASSVPGLSSVIATDLAQELDVIQLVDIAILPGNRAPRGRSVIASITGGVGRPVKVKRGGVWRQIDGWTDKRIYRLSNDLRRAAYVVDVPDLVLLPDRLGADSVTFRAGLELGVMNMALSALAHARRVLTLDLPSGVISFLHLLSKALYPFGSDRGGMQVTVTGTRNGERTERCWTLIAERGDGPFIPGVMCRAIARQPDRISPGARPCFAELPRSAVECAMSDLAVTTEIT